VATLPHAERADATATSRVKVTCLLILPLHPPIELAEAIATLDWLSGDG